jgi:transposase
LPDWYRSLRHGASLGVVALARKLLIALWRFVIDGIVPEGAVMKPPT